MYAPQAGNRVSEYVLVAPVGSGSFGQVWKAHHHVWTDQVVAIKIPTDSQYVRNLRNEGATVHGLRHPNIVRAIGLDPYADPPYFVMEFIDGPSLRDVINDFGKGMPAGLVQTVTLAILSALDHAHQNGVVHRDIKPENILIHTGPSRDVSQLSSEQVKVTDFGLGRATGVTSQSLMQSGSLLSEQGKSIAGTLAYMAPEHRDGRDADQRADLYSVGVLLFEMFTGERPSGNDLPSHVRRDLPSWADRVFGRMYTRHERRYESAVAALGDIGVLSVPPVVVNQSAPPPVRTSQHQACPACNTPQSPGDNFCISCGLRLSAEIRRCQTCGSYPDADDRFCIHCGTELESLSNNAAQSRPV